MFKYKGTQPLSKDLFLKTAKFCFDGIQTLPKSKEPESVRKELTKLYSRIIGYLSASYSELTMNMLDESISNSLSNSNTSIVVSLLNGMKYLQFSIESNEDIETVKLAITKLLDLITKKVKPDIISAIYRLIGNILILLSDKPEKEGIDYTPFREWVTELYYSHKKGWKKLKDSSSGLLMEVGILCNGKRDFFAQQPLSVFDKLGKLTKIGDKNRTIALDCIFSLFYTLFTKYNNNNDNNNSNSKFSINIDLILEKYAKDIFLQTTSKKGVIPHMESVSALTDISTLISLFKIDFALNNFFMNGFQTTDLYERTLVAINFFQNVADNIALCFLIKKTSSETVESLLASNRRSITLKKCSQTTSRCYVSDETLLPIRTILSELMKNLHEQVGELLQFQKGSNELASLGIRPILIQILSDLITSVPRIPPVDTSINELFGYLSKYTFHVNKHIRTLSNELLILIMKTRPLFRSELILEYAYFILNISGVETIYLHRASVFLKDLLVLWMDPTELYRIDPQLGLDNNTNYKNISFPAQKLEALALLLLCNRNSAVRSDGFQLFERIKLLNESLPNELSDVSPRVYMILMANEQDIISRILIDNSLLSMSILPEKSDISKYDGIFSILTSLRIDENQNIICRCIGEICKSLSPNCRDVLKYAFDFAIQKVNQLQNTLLDYKSDKRSLSVSSFRESIMTIGDSLIDQANLWRNYLVIIFSSGDGFENQIKTVISNIVPLVLSNNNIIRNAIQYSIQYCSKNISGNIIEFLLSLYEKENTKKKDITRIEIARIFRYASIFFEFNSLRKYPEIIQKYYSFLKDSIIFLENNNTNNNTQLIIPQGFIIDIPQSLLLLHFNYDLFYSTCIILKNIKLINEDIYSTLRIDEPSLEIRESLFELLLRRCGYGIWKLEQENRNGKLLELNSEYKNDIISTQYWSLSLLNEIVYYNSNEFKNQEIFCDIGPIFSLASDVFKSNIKLSKHTEIATQLIKSFVTFQKNHSALLFHVCIQKSFLESNVNISQAYFNAIVEVICLQSTLDMDFRLSELLTLGLYSLLSPSNLVTTNAVKLLHWLSSRFFKNRNITFKLTSFISSSRLYEKEFDLLCESYSSNHPELCADIILDICTILPNASNESSIRTLLRICTSWFNNLNFLNIEDNINWILKKFMILTFRYKEKFSELIEKLWLQLSCFEENIKIIFLFLIETYIKRPSIIYLDVCQQVIIHMYEKFPNFIINQCMSYLHPYPPYYQFDGSIRNERYELPPPNENISDNNWKFDSLFPEINNNKNNNNNNGKEIDFILLILSDLIVKQKSPFKKVIPILLQYSITKMDSKKINIANAAKKILINIVSELILPKYTEGSNEIKQYLKLKNIILESTNNNLPLWKNEDIGIKLSSIESEKQLTEIVQLVIQILLPVTKSIRENWSKLTLSWATNLGRIKGIHIVSRSFQIFRALESSITKENLSLIATQLIQFIQNRENNNNIQISLEIMKTLQNNCKFTSKKVLKRLPQLFWISVSMLNSPVPEEFLCAVSLVSSLIDDMQVQSGGVYSALLCTEPQRWRPIPYQGIFVPLLKGMCSRKTEPVTRKLFTRLTMSPCTQLLHADEELRYLIPTIALLPYLITSMGREDSIEISEKLAGAYLIWKKPSFVRIFTDYPVYTTSEEGMRRFICESIESVGQLYFPRHEVFVFSILVELMNNGPPCNERAIMQMLISLIDFVDFNKSPLNSTHLPILGSIVPHIESKYWNETLLLIESILKKPSTTGVPALPIDKFHPALEEYKNVNHTWQRNSSNQGMIYALKEAIDPTYQQKESISIENEIDIRDQVKSIKLGKNEIKDIVSRNNNFNTLRSATTSNILESLDVPKTLTKQSPQLERKQKSPNPRNPPSDSNARVGLRPGFRRGVRGVPSPRGFNSVRITNKQGQGQSLEPVVPLDAPAPRRARGNQIGANRRGVPNQRGRGNRVSESPIRDRR